MTFKKAIVLSHERSGTHFLINSIAANFGYREQQLDIDNFPGTKRPVVNWEDPKALHGFLEQYHDKPIANVFKCHHSFEFLQPEMDYLLDQFHVFYIYRDGRDVLTSLWNYLHRLKWFEGPLTETVGELMRTHPAGRMCRYQYAMRPTLLNRWVHQVGDWITQAPKGICYIRYEDLNERFEDTIKTIGQHMNMVPKTLEKPALQGHTVVPWKGKAGNWREFLTPEDEAYFWQYAGELMTQLGYEK